MSIIALGNEGRINPLDIVEEMVATNEWPFDRTSDRELVVEFSGKWCDYRLYFGWVEEICAMQFCCTLDSKVPLDKRDGIYALLGLINERLWLGGFSLNSEENLLCFRQTVLLRGLNGASVEQLEDMVDIAISECERFYPCFQFVVWGGKRPQEALEVALLETAGEA